MQVLVHTDHAIDGGRSYRHQVETEVAEALDHLSHRLGRIEVHLSDENAGKPGAQARRCLLLAHPMGRDVVVLTKNAETIAEALDVAVHTLRRQLESDFRRDVDVRNHSTIRHPSGG